MIIDCNAHLGHWPFRGIENTNADDFGALMDRNEIDRAVVAPYQALLYGDLRPANEWLLDEISDHDERFIPLAAINPAFPDWDGDLENILNTGFPGLALYPNYHCYSLSDDCVHELLVAADEADLFVRLHVRMEDERLHHTRCLVEPVDLTGLAGLARDVAGVRMVIANASNRECDQVAQVLAECQHLFAEISHIEKVAGVELLTADIGTDSLIFGTHAPLQYVESSVLKMKEAILEAEVREAIFHVNADSWMNL